MRRNRAKRAASNQVGTGVHASAALAGLLASSRLGRVCCASAFVASPPTTSLAQTNSNGHIRVVPRKQIGGRRLRSVSHFSNRDDGDFLQGVADGGSGYTVYPPKNESPSSNIYIVDEDDRASSVPAKDVLSEKSSGTYINFEIDEESTGSECRLHTETAVYTDDSDVASSSPLSQKIEYFLKAIPIISPIFAFLTYEQTAGMFDLFVDALANRNWVAVDGGAYQTQIITPAINGIVIPSISILFATLISNTVTTLRQRQLDIRIALNTEAGEIRVLQAMVDSFPESAQLATRSSGMDAQDWCRSYLVQYTSRLLAESQPGVEIDSLMFTGSMDSELNGFLEQLNKITLACADAGENGSIPASLLSESYGAVTRLNAERSKRISALQSTFPMLHYVVLAVLAASICICYVIESDQELLIFLNAIQLKLLWTMLIGTFSALSVVVYDLGDPFHGSYQIAQSLDQLYTIRDTIRASDQMKKANQSEMT